MEANEHSVSKFGTHRVKPALAGIVSTSSDWYTTFNVWILLALAIFFNVWILLSLAMFRPYREQSVYQSLYSDNNLELGCERFWRESGRFQHGVRPSVSLRGGGSGTFNSDWGHQSFDMLWGWKLSFLTEVINLSRNQTFPLWSEAIILFEIEGVENLEFVLRPSNLDWGRQSLDMCQGVGDCQFGLSVHQSCPETCKEVGHFQFGLRPLILTRVKRARRSVNCLLRELFCTVLSGRPTVA